MTRYNRSVELFNSLGLDSNKTDDLLLHALEVIGAISCILETPCLSETDRTSELETAKLSIFWKTIQEIANQKLLERRDDEGCLLTEKSSTLMVLSAFPNKKKRTDGNMWLPMYFAVSLPRVELTEIKTLFKSEPKTIFAKILINLSHGSSLYLITPCNLAVMTKTPNMALIKLLQMYDRNFGSLLDCNDSTQLHLAAEFSNSLALIQDLIQMYPQALGMRNRENDTPLFCVAKNEYTEAPNILKLLIHAYPQTASVTHIGELPLHRFLYGDEYATTKEIIQILLEVYPDAINTPDTDGRLAIHVAIEQSSLEIVKIITEANPDNLSNIIPSRGSVAHCAVFSQTFDIVRYIHSMMPELFLTVNDKQQTPLHTSVGVDGKYRTDDIERMVNLVPETATHVDINGDNLLHALLKRDGEEEENVIRHLLRLIPGGALATNNQGQTPYDLIHKDRAPFIQGRRLHPETRKQMNYQARKGALFAFFAGVYEPNIFYRIRNTGTGIVLMRQIVSFL